MSALLEKVLADKNITGSTAAEIRAFERFLGRVPRPLGPATVAAMDHWDRDYVEGGPHPPHRWEGDDS